MFKKNKDEFKYSKDTQLRQIRSSLFTIGTYIFIMFLWQYTLSYQSSMYTLMNSCVFVMFAFGTAGLFICHEERDNIIRHTKQQVIYYLLVIFIYDMFFRVVLNDLTISATLGTADPSLTVARQFILTMSTVLKVGFPIAYVTWMLQKFGIFKSRKTKHKMMESLRDVRKETKNKLGNQDENIDRF